MKRNKRGISLIVLVITIIVMIILAAAIIIAINNNSVLDRANQAVKDTDLAQVKHIVTLAWSEAYLENRNETDEAKRLESLNNAVNEALEEYNISTDKYDIQVTDKGVSVTEFIPTLGNLITDPTVDYGKTIDYTVTVDGTEYKDWQIFYEDKENGHVYIITKEGIPTSSSTNTLPSFVNNADYGNYVIGYTKTMSLSMFAKAYNEKHNDTIITILENCEYSGGGGIDDYSYVDGTYINEAGTTSISLEVDGIYVKDDSNDYWTMDSAPVWYQGSDYGQYLINSRGISFYGYIFAGYFRPVVCLKSDIPATKTATGYSIATQQAE